jgi:NAD(P)H-flavin reductase
MAALSQAEPAPAPDWSPAPFRVVERRQETADTWTFALEGPEPLDFAPGQFTMLSAGGCGEVPISISGDPAHPERLVHTVRAVGAATRAICATEPGRVLSVRGPFGRPWPVSQARGADVVVIAGGVGLAPVRPAIEAVLGEREAFGRMAVLYGSREPDLLLFKDELVGWSQSPALELAVTVDTAARDWRGHVGVVPRLVRHATFDPASAVAFVVGPEVMMRFSVAALLERGVPEERIFVSLERNMQCGIGRCGHCQLGPVLLCRDGPVFSFAEVGDLMTVREL